MLYQVFQARLLGAHHMRSEGRILTERELVWRWAEVDDQYPLLDEEARHLVRPVTGQSMPF